MAAVRASVVEVRGGLGGSLVPRRRAGGLPARKAFGLGAASLRPAAARAVRGEGQPLTAGGGGGAGNGAGAGDGNGGNGGDEDFGYGGGSGLAMAAAVPLFDLSGTLSLDLEKVLLFIACVLLPVLGVYIYTRRVDKYLFLSALLTFLPPFGIIFAIAVCFANFRF